MSKFYMEMRKRVMPGDLMVLKGKVTKKYVQDNDHLVDADVWIETPKEGITNPSKCTVILPTKG